MSIGPRKRREKFQTTLPVATMVACKLCNIKIVSFFASNLTIFIFWNVFKYSLDPNCCRARNLVNFWLHIG